MKASRYAAAALALAILAAGCGSASRPAQAPGSSAVPLSLTTAVTGPGATWAAVPMGATSGADQFWQLFMLPASSNQWSLQTPPDIATNGALILAGQAGQGIIVGERPSLYLTFSAITTTRDGGNDWATLPPASGLADVPDALAAAPDGHLIALGGNQQVTVTGPRRLGHADHPARPGRHARGPQLRADRAHRGRLHPGRIPRPGRDMRARGHRRRLRLRRRDMAPGRARAARLAGPAARAGPAAEPDGQRRRGPAPGGHRAVGEPARRLDQRRPAVEALSRLQARRRAPSIGILRLQRRDRRGPVRPPRRDPRRSRSILAGAAPAAIRPDRHPGPARRGTPTRSPPTAAR